MTYRGNHVRSFLLTASAILVAMTLATGAGRADGTAGNSHDMGGSHEVQSTAGSQAIDLATLKQDWGIELVAVRRSAAGHMLDLRYRVTDADKARPIVEGRMKPMLVDETRELALQVPAAEKVGQLRNLNLSSRPDYVYFMLFVNPGRSVQSGDKVTLVLGDLRVGGIPVGG